MKKVVLSGFLLVPEQELEQVLNALPAHIERTQSEAGCITFSVSSDSKFANRLNVYEEFEDRPAYELHQQRVRESKWGQVTQNCSRHYKLEEV